MRGEPDGEHRQRQIPHDPLDQRVPVAEDHLPDAEPAARPHEFPVDRLRVGPRAEEVARYVVAGRAEAADQPVVPVVAHEAVVEEVFLPFWPPGAVEVAHRAVEAEVKVAEVLRDHVELVGPEHAHGDVRLAEEEVVGRVARHEFDGDLGQRLADAGDDGRQDVLRHRDAGRHADRARHRVRLSGGGERKRPRGAFHLARRSQKLRPCRGRAHPLRVPLEERRAHRSLERRDLPPDRGLARPEPPRGGGIGAGLGHREEDADQRPVGEGIGVHS